jgi:hypothetical protein
VGLLDGGASIFIFIGLGLGGMYVRVGLVMSSSLSEV